jgi:hypothetical protein
MSERQDEPPRDPGFYSRRGDDRAFGPVEVAAVAASALWLAVAGFLALTGGAGAGGALLTLVAVVLPVAVIWIGALTLRGARTMRQEAERLQAAMDAMRHAWLTQTQAGVGKSAVEKKLEEIAAAQKQTESALATFTSRRDALPATAPPAPVARPAPAQPASATAPAAPAAEDQPALALGTPADALRAPVSTMDLIRALNFPDSQDDREGFGALRGGCAAGQYQTGQRNTETGNRQPRIIASGLDVDRCYRSGPGGWAGCDVVGCAEGRQAKPGRA